MMIVKKLMIMFMASIGKDISSEVGMKLLDLQKSGVIPERDPANIKIKKGLKLAMMIINNVRRLMRVL